jgi:nucleoside-diphosphate-sugar epimerase
MQPTTFTPAIPASSTVLVTGVNGFIGSHIADQFLKYGYKVRGTSRDPKKHTWLCTLFDKAYGTGRFELVSVPDMEASGAYDDAVKGAITLFFSLVYMSLDMGFAK